MGRISDDVCDAVKFFEAHPLINPGSNASFITLIPKVCDPLKLSNYRPINLIGCVTKIISKVLAGSIKEVISTVIRKMQTTFIKRRSILEGPLVVNEILAWAKMAKKQMILFKVDFEKTFDMLNWGFLDDFKSKCVFVKGGGLGLGDAFQWRSGSDSC